MRAFRRVSRAVNSANPGRRMRRASAVSDFPPPSAPVLLVGTAYIRAPGVFEHLCEHRQHRSDGCAVHWLSVQRNSNTFNQEFS